MSDENQYKPIEKNIMESFIAEIDRLKERQDKAGTEIAQCYKEHKNTFGLHTKAAKLALSLRNMESDTRSDFLRAFDEYRDTLGLDSQIDLFDSAPGVDERSSTLQAVN